MSSSPASAISQPSPSPSPQAQSKTLNLSRKPIRRPVSGSVSSQPGSPQSVTSQPNIVPNPQDSLSMYTAPELTGSFVQGLQQPTNSSTTPPEPMSQRSSISETPSYNGAQEHNAFSTCKLCNHCKSGIPYDTPYFRCRFCQYYLCRTCEGAHPSSHQHSLVHMLSRRTLPDATRFEKSCCQCLKPVHCRHDCQQCSICYCDDCFLSKEGSHEHSSFNTSEAPSHHLKISDEKRNQECCTNPVISHCSRCQSSIGPQQYAFLCKTCLFKFDASVKFCQPCYTESWYSHDQTHECITVVRQPVPDDAQTYLGCSQCNGRFSSLNRMTFDQHPHNAYISYMGPKARETAVHTAFRSCQRKHFRDDQPQVTLECTRCKLDFPDHKMRICAGPCDGTFCDQCFPQASFNHIHGPSNFRSTADEARPEIGFLPAGWRALKNTEGRIYYMEEQGKRFTFDKPQVPNTLPAGWTSMLDDKGKPYYLDHNTRSSTYVSPVYGVAPAGYELRQTNTGRLYYVNRKTQAATWHKPLPANEKLPAGWEAGQHADGRIYYINHLAKTTQWTKPTSPARAPAQSAQPLRHPAPASHQAAPARTSLGHASAPASSGATRPTAQVSHPQHATPHTGHAVSHTAPHHAQPTAASVGHATAGPRPGVPVHRPATTTSAGPPPGAQHTAPAPHTTAPAQRPSMPHQVASAPAASTTAANMRSSLNALAHNPKAQKVALGLGLSVFKAAVASDIDFGNTDISNIGFSGTDVGGTGLDTVDFSGTDVGSSLDTVDFSSTDVGSNLDVSGITQEQDSGLGTNSDPTAVEPNEVLVQESNTESYFVPAEISETQSTWSTADAIAVRESTISPPLMSPTGWTDPGNSDGSYVQIQGQAGYGVVPFVGNQSSQQNYNLTAQNAPHQNPMMHTAQHQRPVMHPAQHQKPGMRPVQQPTSASQNSQHRKPAAQNAQRRHNATPDAQQRHNGKTNTQHQNPTMQNSQQHNNAVYNTQHDNPTTNNVYYPGNKPTNLQNPNSYNQQGYQAVNDTNVVYTTDGTDDPNYTVTQTETVDVTETYDSHETETTYTDTTTYTIQDDGSTDTVDYSFVTSQDYSSDC